jgi:uncharacterized protein YjbJ (UPF0337 family)
MKREMCAYVNRYLRFPLVVLRHRPVPECESLQGRNQVKSGTKNEIAGKVHEVKGKIKQKVGQVTNNPSLEIEGLGEKIAGKVQTKVGQVQKAGEKS